MSTLWLFMQVLKRSQEGTWQKYKCIIQVLRLTLKGSYKQRIGDGGCHHHGFALRFSSQNLRWWPYYALAHYTLIDLTLNPPTGDKWHIELWFITSWQTVPLLTAVRDRIRRRNEVILLLMGIFTGPNNLVSPCICLSVCIRDDPSHKAGTRGVWWDKGLRLREQVVAIRTDWGSGDETGFLMMWWDRNDEANTSAWSLSNKGTWACVCDWCVWLMCATGAHDCPAHVCPTESTERMNGIRRTRVIQLAWGREVCPHPSAGGDKDVLTKVWTKAHFKSQINPFDTLRGYK